ncbi:uncharacterized protein BJ212DRAFT_1066407 [Suillus subaureus]|uniref:Uncharacterized protein n=1 Tax=Suillus subaureus TaxID=48587 RepID=A0A9P7EFW3_9AGAM|nr:uncharacterized protein BJ212DRAFT_1066407 [Suillus subaureus]KAG1819787.1 hypothetical protein BJ212DRAFT_1066407 [Suillus subaureus]
MTQPLSSNVQGGPSSLVVFISLKFLQYGTEVIFTAPPPPQKHSSKPNRTAMGRPRYRLLQVLILLYHVQDMRIRYLSVCWLIWYFFSAARLLNTPMPMHNQHSSSKAKPRPRRHHHRPSLPFASCCFFVAHLPHIPMVIKVHNYFISFGNYVQQSCFLATRLVQCIKLNVNRCERNMLRSIKRMKAWELARMMVLGNRGRIATEGIRQLGVLPLCQLQDSSSLYASHLHLRLNWVTLYQGNHPPMRT